MNKGSNGSRCDNQDTRGAHEGAGEPRKPRRAEREKGAEQSVATENVHLEGKVQGQKATVLEKVAKLEGATWFTWA